MCKHLTSNNQHTASGFYGTMTEYCVYCMWTKFSNYSSLEIPVNDLKIADNLAEIWDDYTINMEKHESRINTADMSYPIFITSRKEIIDGCHRLVKAKRLGNVTICAVVISEADLAEVPVKVY